jgi:hypothetical protein
LCCRRGACASRFRLFGESCRCTNNTSQRSPISSSLNAASAATGERATSCAQTASRRCPRWVVPRAPAAAGRRPHLRPSSATPARGLGFGFESDRAPLIQPGGGPRAGRRGGAGRTRFGYTGGGAQDAGPGRAHDWRAADERRGSLRGLGTRARQGSPSRRRLHHRRDDELVRRDPPARRGPGGARGEPLQHGMRRAGQLVSTPLAERRRTWR